MRASSGRAPDIGSGLAAVRVVGDSNRVRGVRRHLVIEVVRKVSVCRRAGAGRVNLDAVNGTSQP